jgi:hypothetical protein
MTGRILLGIGALCLMACAWSDDGILYFYGTPELMHGESRIRMVSEVVTARVCRDHADVHCRFVFHNDGGAMSARIGFPDRYEPPPEGDEKPRPSLKNFRSTVDGRVVAVRFEDNYHSKRVRFRKGQTRVIEDWYGAPLSGGGTNSIAAGGHENLYIAQFTYIMASGGSWHGNIGDATMTVEFMETKLQKVQPIDQRVFGDVVEYTKYASLPPNMVIWSGFAVPQAVVNKLIFKRHNFKPTSKDDICLTFDWQKYFESHWNDVR